MLSSALNRSRMVFIQRGSYLRNSRHLMRNLFTLNEQSTRVWNPVRVPNIKSDVANCNLPSAAMNKYSTKPNPVIAEYSEIKDLPNNPDKFLIDVRESKEIKTTGSIPTAINIPLSKVHLELGSQVSAEEFQKKYGRPKPDTDATIIFSCLSGKRAQTAAEIAAHLGFKDVRVFDGSWMQWAQKENIETKSK